jgi:hypothetical protein
LRDLCVFILDPTPEIADKREQMKHYSHTLMQIEENIAKVVRLKHPNYEVKHWDHCIVDNVPYGSRYTRQPCSFTNNHVYVYITLELDNPSFLTRNYLVLGHCNF